MWGHLSEEMLCLGDRNARSSTRYWIVLLVAALSCIGFSGCATSGISSSKPPPGPAPVPTSQTTTLASGYLDVDSVPPGVRHTLGPGERFNAKLARSVEGTLGGSVYFYRRFSTPYAGSPFGIFVFAVTPSSIATLVALPLTAPTRVPVPSRLSGGLAGGLVALYSHLPSDTVAIRLASTTEPGSLDNSSTVWLEVRLSEIPILPVGKPRGM